MKSPHASVRSAAAAVSLKGGTSPTSSQSSSPNSLRELVADIVEPTGVGLKADVCTYAATFGTSLRAGVNMKVVSTVCFLVFGCLAPAVAFGGLCDVVTKGNMGTIEMVDRPSASSALFDICHPHQTQLQ